MTAGSPSPSPFQPLHPDKTFLDEKSYNAALREDIAAILNIHIRLATAIHLLHGELNDFGDGLSNLVELGSGRTVPLFDMIGQQFDSMYGRPRRHRVSRSPLRSCLGLQFRARPHRVSRGGGGRLLPRADRCILVNALLCHVNR